MKKSKNVHDFERDLLRLVGLEGRQVRKVVITLEYGNIPQIETVEELLNAPETVVAKSYRLVEE